MAEGYRTLAKMAEAELVERKSRFIGLAAPITAEREAQELLAGVKNHHRTARHHVFAYLLRSGAKRCSDDGEPQGTGGVPVLEVLRREGITDAIIVVTRYFGGTLLGAGGLMRAYGGAAGLALDAAGKAEMTPCIRYEITYGYHLHGKVSYLVQQIGGVLAGCTFGEQVVAEALIPASEGGPLQQVLMEATAGEVSTKILAEAFINLSEL